MAHRRIRVLVVEDSCVMRELLVHVLNSDPHIEVVATAGDGAAAIQASISARPDVITMDITMPGANGFEVTRTIMETQPVPIVIVSASWSPEEVATTFRAVEAGAVAIIQKPRGLGHPEYSAMAARLIETVKRMAEVKLVRRWPHLRKVPPGLAVPPPPPLVARPNVQIVAIGASTGGPLVLQTILAALPATFAVPILVVQHIAAGFTLGLVQWLGPATGFPVHLAEHGQTPQPGHAYIAPDGAHLGVNAAGRVILSSDPPEGGLRPAVSFLFRSVAATFGDRVVGVLLTGMGKDGTEELKRLRDMKAQTIVQDKASSVVHGMPGEAIRLGAATYVLPPERIATMLQGLVGPKRPTA